MRGAADFAEELLAGKKTVVAPSSLERAVDKELSRRSYR